ILPHIPSRARSGRSSPRALRHLLRLLFLFSRTPSTKLYTLSLHDALPIYTTMVLLSGVKGEGDKKEACQIALDFCWYKPLLSSVCQEFACADDSFVGLS